MAGVPNNPEASPRARDRFQQASRRAVDVLELVDEDVSEVGLNALADPLVRLQEEDGPIEEVAEVDGSRVVEEPFVGRVRASGSLGHLGRLGLHVGRR